MHEEVSEARSGHVQTIEQSLVRFAESVDLLTDRSDMLSDRSATLLAEANAAHAQLAAEVGRVGPVFVDGQDTDARNAANWLADDKPLVRVSLALERLVAARARLAMSLRMDYADAAENLPAGPT